MIRGTHICLVAIAVGFLLAPPSASAQSGRPTVEPTTVEIAVVLLDLERIDDAAQSFSASVFLLGARL